MLITRHNLPLGKIYTRIISLVPSQTELLYDLGLREEVVGITKFCVHPPVWHRNKPRVGGTKHIKIPSIHQLKPELIIANKEENTKEQVEELAKTYDVFVTEVDDLAGAAGMISDVGALVGKTNEAVNLNEAIELKFAKLAACKPPKRKAAYLIWKDPYMAAGGHTFINNMMQYCGLENVFASSTRYPQITPGELRNNCDVILLSSEPYPFKEKHIEEISSEIPGIKVMLVDGELFSWYGSRLLIAAGYFENLPSKLA